MKKVITINIVFIITTTLPKYLSAEATSDNDNAFDGYLVKFSEYMMVMAKESGERDAEYVLPNVYKIDDLSMVEDYIKSGLVEYFEPNYYVSLFDSPDEAILGWAYESMNAASAEDLGLNGTGINIAVIDSGVALTSPDLQDANIALGYDYINATDVMEDTLGHGTLVTQMIAGDADDIGVTGIARNATIIPLRCFTSRDDATLANLARALTDAVEVYGCSVINMSWGTTANSSTLYSAIKTAYDAGAILVAAAGNVTSEVPQGSLIYPAAYDEVIGVGSVNSTMEVSSFSQQTAAVYVCAPGANVCEGSSGTSFASPCVAGVAALVSQINPGISPIGFQLLLEERTIDLGLQGYDAAYGYGFVRLDQLFGQTWYQINMLGKGLGINGWMRHVGGGTIMTALYDSGNRMVCVKSISSQQDVSGFDFSLNADYVSYIKLFQLDNEYKPVGDAEILVE